MNHRRNRDAPTKGRRIHATDEEWSRVQAAAAKAQMSVSAYVVQAAQAGKVAAQGNQLSGTIRLLTACHGLLSEIAWEVAHLNDTDAAFVASELVEVSALLEAFLITATDCHDAARASRCC